MGLPWDLSCPILSVDDTEPVLMKIHAQDLTMYLNNIDDNIKRMIERKANRHRVSNKEVNISVLEQKEHLPFWMPGQ